MCYSNLEAFTQGKDKDSKQDDQHPIISLTVQVSPLVFTRIAAKGAEYGVDEGYDNWNSGGLEYGFSALVKGTLWFKDSKSRAIPGTDAKPSSRFRVGVSLGIGYQPFETDIQIDAHADSTAAYYDTSASPTRVEARRIVSGEDLGETIKLSYIALPLSLVFEYELKHQSLYVYGNVGVTFLVNIGATYSNGRGSFTYKNKYKDRGEPVENIVPHGLVSDHLISEEAGDIAAGKLAGLVIAPSLSVGLSKRLGCNKYLNFGIDYLGPSNNAADNRNNDDYTVSPDKDTYNTLWQAREKFSLSSIGMHIGFMMDLGGSRRTYGVSLANEQAGFKKLEEMLLEEKLLFEEAEGESFVLTYNKSKRTLDICYDCGVEATSKKGEFKLKDEQLEMGSTSFRGRQLVIPITFKEVVEAKSIEKRFVIKDSYDSKRVVNASYTLLSVGGEKTNASKVAVHDSLLYTWEVSADFYKSKTIEVKGATLRGKEVINLTDNLEPFMVSLEGMDALNNENTSIRLENGIAAVDKEGTRYRQKDLGKISSLAYVYELIMDKKCNYSLFEKNEKGIKKALAWSSESAQEGKYVYKGNASLNTKDWGKKDVIIRLGFGTEKQCSYDLFYVDVSGEESINLAKTKDFIASFIKDNLGSPEKEIELFVSGSSSPCFCEVKREGEDSPKTEKNTCRSEIVSCLTLQDPPMISRDILYVMGQTHLSEYLNQSYGEVNLHFFLSDGTYILSTKKLLKDLAHDLRVSYSINDARKQQLAFLLKDDPDFRTDVLNLFDTEHTFNKAQLLDKLEILFEQNGLSVPAKKVKYNTYKEQILSITESEGANKMAKVDVTIYTNKPEKGKFTQNVKKEYKSIKQRKP